MPGFICRENPRRSGIYFFTDHARLKFFFEYVGKILDDRGFIFLPTIPDSGYISVNRWKPVPDSSYYEFGCKLKI